MPTCECKIHSNISEDLDYSIILQTLYVKSCTSSNCMAYCHFCYLSLWVNIHLYWMKRSSLDYVLSSVSCKIYNFIPKLLNDYLLRDLFLAKLSHFLSLWWIMMDSLPMVVTLLMCICMNFVTSPMVAVTSWHLKSPTLFEAEWHLVTLKLQISPLQGQAASSFRG